MLDVEEEIGEHFEDTEADEVVMLAVEEVVVEGTNVGGIVLSTIRNLDGLLEEDEVCLDILFFSCHSASFSARVIGGDDNEDEETDEERSDDAARDDICLGDMWRGEFDNMFGVCV
jgi:hypothetical protein